MAKTTVEFIDAIRAKHNLPSDYAAKKLLSVSRATISNYRTGKQFFDDAVALRAAELLDLSPGHVLACIHEERAKRPQVKAAWHQVARALAPSLLVFLAGALGATPQISQGSGLVRDVAMYIMSNRRRIRPDPRSSLLEALRRFSPFPLFPGTAFA